MTNKVYMKIVVPNKPWTVMRVDDNDVEGFKTHLLSTYPQAEITMFRYLKGDSEIHPSTVDNPSTR